MAETSKQAADAPAITLANVGKCYHLSTNKRFLLRDLFGRALGRKPDGRDFWALRDVSFDVARGEAVGVIGHNGAGKSTLLGIVAGTIYPTLGRARITGRVSALLELGAGFHPDLTGRENVFLNASLLGMSRQQAEERFDRIVGFSELEEFIDSPIRTYSSGMWMRLGFAVAVFVEPEILIVDEVLAVGDADFQAKCCARILELKARGTTFLFVSHSEEQIRFLCSRVIWIEHGVVVADGGVEEVLRAYEQARTRA